MKKTIILSITSLIILIGKMDAAVISERQYGFETTEIQDLSNEPILPMTSFYSKVKEEQGIFKNNH
tara:strand:+ start:546 stop:743 length:198 start_codon:yes stop_codon:yes gene_type:complete